MALSNNQVLQLQGNARARRLFALEFNKAFNEIHKAFPTRPNFATDEDYNKAVAKYVREISVKSELGRSIESDGKLNIFATNVYLAALQTYDINTSETGDALTDIVLAHEEGGFNACFLEATKILKGWSFQPQPIEIV
jgi:hypothetical protein